MDSIKVARRSVDIEGKRISYLESGEGETVLLVHGITTYSFIWDEIIPALSYKYHVIAIDLLGCGSSDKPLSESYSLTNHAELICKFLKELKIEKNHFVGHDLGGGIAQIFAVNNPGMLHDFTLINSVAYDFWPVQPIIAVRTPIIRQLVMATLDLGVFKLIVKRGVYNKERVTTEVMSKFWRPMQTQEGRKGFLHFAECLNNKNLLDISEKLHNTKLPLLIIRGDSDVYLSSEISKRLHDNINTSRLIIINNAGHFIQLDEPTKITELLISFFERTCE
ncbi:MAG: alpha/beta hydrolase [Bacteroidota bacterium]